MEMIAEMMNRYPSSSNSSFLKANTNDLSVYRLNQSCVKKCIPPEYREGDLNKGESVCLDRCVSKFFDVQMKVSEKMQGDAAMRQGQGL